MAVDKGDRCPRSAGVVGPRRIEDHNVDPSFLREHVLLHGKRVSLEGGDLKAKSDSETGQRSEGRWNREDRRSEGNFSG